MTKKWICMVLSALTACAVCVSIASCGSESDEKNAGLTVWGSADDQSMLGEMINGFKDAYEDLKMDIAVKVTGEDLAKDQALKDIDAAADVFAIGHDQIGSLVEAGAVYEITGEYKEAIEAACDKSAIKAATYNGKLYGFPSTAETYFLYYDKSKFSESDVASLNTMIDKQLADGVSPFGMNLKEGYYGTSLFFTAGCTLYGENGDDPTSCDFNNANGLKAAKFIASLKDKGVLNCDENEAVSQMKAGKLASYVGGPWKADAMKEALGDNYAVAKLPAVALAEGDEQKQIISFAGYKIYVVNAKTKNPTEAMKLAAHLTSEANQLKRFKDRGLLPVNQTAAKDESLSETPAVKATLDQLQHTVPMPGVAQISVYWTAFKAFTDDCFAGNIAEANLQGKLDNLVSQIVKK